MMHSIAHAMKKLKGAYAGIPCLGQVTDFVAFKCLPAGHSAMLSAHRFEGVDRRSGYAALGMQTVLAAIQFRTCDPDNNKAIEAEDLVRILASVSCDDAKDPTVQMTAEKVGRRDQMIGLWHSLLACPAC